MAINAGQKKTFYKCNFEENVWNIFTFESKLNLVEIILFMIKKKKNLILI